MKKYNKQGIRLIDDQILVLFDEVDDEIAEKDLGNGKKLYMAKSLDSDERAKQHRMDQASQTKATIVDMSDEAFLDLRMRADEAYDKVDLDSASKSEFDGTTDKWYELKNQIPEIGERIFMSKYAGEFVKGSDDVDYKVIREGEINCFINF